MLCSTGFARKIQEEAES